MHISYRMSAILMRRIHAIVGNMAYHKGLIFARHVIAYHKFFRCVMQLVRMDVLGRNIRLLFRNSIL